MQPRGSDGDASDDRSPDAVEIGGDPVCWLELTCPACGALLDRPGAHRPGCEAAGREDREG